MAKRFDEFWDETKREVRQPWNEEVARYAAREAWLYQQDVIDAFHERVTALGVILDSISDMEGREGMTDAEFVKQALLNIQHGAPWPEETAMTDKALVDKALLREAAEEMQSRAEFFASMRAYIPAIQDEYTRLTDLANRLIAAVEEER